VLHQLRIEQSLMEALDEVATSNGISRNKLITNLIHEGLGTDRNI